MRPRLWRWRPFTSLCLLAHYMGKSSKVIQSSSCVTTQTYVFSCLFIFFSLVHFVFLFEGSSSNTHVLAQRVAWPNAGSVLSCSATTLQRTQQTCWWRHFSCSPLPLLLPGSHHFCIFFFFCVGNTFSSICYGSCE